MFRPPPSWCNANKNYRAGKNDWLENRGKISPWNRQSMGLLWYISIWNLQPGEGPRCPTPSTHGWVSKFPKGTNTEHLLLPSHRPLTPAHEKKRLIFTTYSNNWIHLVLPNSGKNSNQSKRRVVFAARVLASFPIWVPTMLQLLFFLF